ncbi:response regulator [Thermodesulfobacteriota bacterium]
MEKEKTVLFSEPGEATAKGLAPFLERYGYKLFTAGSLKETLLTLQEERVDALVIDARLLEDDCGFISVIKGIDKDLPIIICAESNTPELESKIRKQKIFYYHIKSFGLEDLEMAVSNAVNSLSQ